MKLTSTSFEHRGPIPERCAYARPGTELQLADNFSPQLAWEIPPPGTRSFALLCIDPDVPVRFDDANQQGRVIASELPRRDFIHWVLLDIPAEQRELAEGSCSRASGGKGKANPPGPQGSVQGVNDYGAEHRGYDGPCPPWNDERVHRYFFRLFALDVASLGLDASCTAAQALRAMQGHVLAETAIHGTYTRNPALVP